MHLPDGFLNNQVSISLLVVAVGFLVSSFLKLWKLLTKKVAVARSQLALADGPTTESLGSQRSVLTKKGQEKVQLLAMLGALIFALQMINFPVTNGTSGHFIGGVLAAIVLGPWAGVIVISLVLIVQSLIFADGGIITLGANIFNMGVVASFGGYYLYKLVNKLNKFLQFLVIGIVAWLSVVVASFFCALEIGFSGTISLALVTIAMVKVHLLIGLGEALLTVIIIKTLKLRLDED